MKPALTTDLQTSVKIQCPPVVMSQEPTNVLVTVDIIAMVAHVLLVSILVSLLR
jgi:hypothetical protein